MRFQVFLSLWSVTSCLCLDKIPEVAKTKVSKPKRYSLSKLRLCHAPLKWLIQTRTHMSTSRCGNICIMQPKCSSKERRCGFSNRSSAHVRERGRHGHITTAACVQTHTSIITVSVTRLCSSFGLELMVKLRTLLTVFTFILKAKARDYGKGCYISDAAYGVRPITMHWVSWPIRADCACRKEGLCRKPSVWERRGIEEL